MGLSLRSESAGRDFISRRRNAGHDQGFAGSKIGLRRAHGVAATREACISSHFPRPFRPWPFRDLTPCRRAPMRFNLVDRIHNWEPGKRLTASKGLTLGDEYLADHFPTFPVMPGVLMLQAVTEASTWLWRATTGFQHSVIVIREVKNVKYGTFMPPGHTLELATELL